MGGRKSGEAGLERTTQSCGGATLSIAVVAKEEGGGWPVASVSPAG